MSCASVWSLACAEDINVRLYYSTNKSVATIALPPSIDDEMPLIRRMSIMVFEVKEGKSEEPEAGINTLKTLKSWRCSWRKQ